MGLAGAPAPTAPPESTDNKDSDASDSPPLPLFRATAAADTMKQTTLEQFFKPLPKPDKSLAIVPSNLPYALSRDCSPQKYLQPTLPELNAMTNQKQMYEKELEKYQYTRDVVHTRASHMGLAPHLSYGVFFVSTCTYMHRSHVSLCLSTCTYPTLLRSVLLEHMYSLIRSIILRACQTGGIDSPMYQAIACVL